MSALAPFVKSIALVDVATVNTVIEQLHNASSIAIISHYNPDPDAYGSICGLGNFLKNAGKQIELINQDGPLDWYTFIPGVSEVLTQPRNKTPDLIVVCDCGDLSRVGDSLVPFVSSRKSINIDHHSSNGKFGTVNLVEEAASSTSEMVLAIIVAYATRYNKEPAFTAASAQGLLAGIVADTGSFRYSSTSARTFASAQCLTQAGAKPFEIAQNMFSRNSLAAVRLHAMAISRIKLYADAKVSVVTVDQALLTEAGATEEESEGLVEKARDIEGVQIAALIRYADGIWRISLRSRDARYNVAEVAQKFGGGGHKVAAAFRFRRSLEELNAQLIPALEGLARSA